MPGHRLIFGANNNRCHNLTQMVVTHRGHTLKLPHKQPFYRKAALRFHCTGCGKCCHGNPDTHYIAIGDREAARIQRHLKMSLEKFLSTFTEVLPWGEYGIRLRPDGACPFLLDEQCQIYQLRPAQCQTYPFWPEVVETNKDWLSEARRCEGINHGDIFPLKEIEQRLKQGRD